MHVAALHKWSLAEGREEKEGLQEKERCPWRETSGHNKVLLNCWGCLIQVLAPHTQIIWDTGDCRFDFNYVETLHSGNVWCT